MMFAHLAHATAPARSTHRAPEQAATSAGPQALQGDPSDDEGTALMRRIAAHDQQALECFYRASIGRVFGLALRITRNRETAEEVAEDVYVQLWHRAVNFDPMRGSPLAWTLTICRSRALDALRRVDQAILDADPSERPDAWLEAGGNPQDLLQASRQNAALHKALNRLRPQQRQLLSLAFFCDLSHAELAAHTGLPLGTVKSQLRRTLASLRKDLDSA
jgi:RNA polymerase sigma factor (sigma-70 family)